MKQTLLVAIQELWINIRRPGFIIMTLLLPALGMIGLVLAPLFSGEVGDFVQSQFVPILKAVGYVDHSNLLGADLPQYEGKFIPYPDEDSAREALLAEEIGSYFVLPPDYLETGTVHIYGIGGGLSTFVAADEGNIDDFLIDNLLTGKVTEELQIRVVDPLDIELVMLDEQGQVNTETPFSWLADFVMPYVFSILFIVTIFTASGFLLQGVSEEKEGRIIEILLSSISSTQLLAGKILGLGALGLIQVFVWIAAGAILLSIAVAIFALTGLINLSLVTVVLGVVYFVLGYLLFATLMAVAGSMGTTQRESQQIAGVFSMIAALPMMAMSVLFTNPGSPIAVALSYFPLTSPVMMLFRLGVSQVPPGQIVLSLVLLILGIAVSLWAGAKIFRTGLLMYGKRPSLKDLARAFKQA
jgi:ABC-2 type transport system permease protein